MSVLRTCTRITDAKFSTVVLQVTWLACSTFPDSTSYNALCTIVSCLWVTSFVL